MEGSSNMIEMATMSENGSDENNLPTLASSSNTPERAPLLKKGSDKDNLPTLTKSQQDVKIWIKENIKVKECGHFVVESKDNPEKCKCGWLKSQHQENQLGGSETQWRANSINANAFGELEFNDSDNQVAKFVRVGHETDIYKILNELLIERWKLEKPNLLISVTGGARNFDMKARLKKVFRRGLRRAAESTGAWIITGGSNTGVMKYVGEAIKEISISDKKNNVVAIGVAPWGCVQNRERLINQKGVWPCEYSLKKESKEDEALLDPNHTHFLLVDNGTQNKWTTEISFRWELEKAIAEMNKTDDTVTETKDIPVVLLVLQGGPGTFQAIHGDINNKIPTVVIKGTGGAADIIAQAFERAKPTEVSKIDQNGAKIKETIMELDETAEGDLISKLKESYDENSVEDFMKMIRDIIKNKDLLTVFELDSRDSTVDEAILKALLKANKNDAMDQLELALVWDKVDVAKNDILEDENLDRMKLNLPEKMLTALHRDRVSFVDLFIDYGVNLKQFLTKEKLLQLYNNIPENCLLYNMLRKSKIITQSKEEITLADIGKLLQYLVGNYYNPYYNEGTNPTSDDDSTTDDRLKVKDLFIWSVLMNRQDMAKLFWKELDEPLAAALFANSLYKAMNKKSKDTEISITLDQHAEEFNDTAIGVLNSYYMKDEVKTQAILVRELRNWGDTTCVIMAVQANNKRFISQTACQTLLDFIWKGKLLQDNSYWRIIPSIVLFPLIFTRFVKFKDVEIANVIPVADKDKETSSSDGEGNRKKSPTAWYRLKSFYLAPTVIFFLNVLSYLAFLVLYSYHLLVSFNPTFTVIEYVLCGWVATFSLEEIRQFINSNATSECSRIRSYFNDKWNFLDVATIVLFVIGIVLRIPDNEETFEVARVFLCLNLISFYFRILHIYSVSKQLGPKLVMIVRMVEDLLYFVMILLVFIMAYAVATEAILYPNTEWNWKLLYLLSRKAYWQIYGELFLEDIEGQNDCTNNATLYTDYNQQRCPSEVGKYAAPVLMGFYVLMTNVLLLNLLIAMFSYTFQKIQNNTDLHWYFRRYHLVQEYYSRPFLPPPAIIIVHVYLFLKYIYGCIKSPETFGACCGKSNQPSDFRKVYDMNGQEERQLIQWGRVIAEAYCNKVELASMESINQRFTSVLERFGNIETRFQGIEEQVGARLENIETRIQGIEEQTKVTHDVLDWIMKSLTEHKLASKAKRPELADAEERLQKR